MRPFRLIRRQAGWWFVAACLLLLALGAYVVSHRPAATPPAPWFLDVELRVSSGTLAQVFWTAETDFVDSRSSTAPLRPGLDVPQRLRFVIPAGVRWIRFDPTDAPGEVRLAGVILRDSRSVLRVFGPADFTSPHQILSVTPEGNGARLIAAGNDSWIILAVGCLDAGVDRPGGPAVTGTSAMVAGLTILALIALCAGAVSLNAFRGDEIPEPLAPMASRITPIRTAWLWMVAFFLLVFGAKLLLIAAFPLRVPFWDQWDGEARAVYLPFAQCGLTWPQMFNLHNEHRIFFSRLLALDLLLLNGQWDPRVQQVVNAALHTFTGLLLVMMLWKKAGRRHLDVIVLAVALVFALPFAWENTLAGFQSAFYLMLLFAILALWLTSEFPPSDPWWWLGWACALAGLFTAAGGILVPPVICLIVLMHIVSAPSSWPRGLVTLAGAGAVLAVGYVASSPPLPHHDALKAKTALVFFRALGGNLAWPWIETPAMALIVWLPLGVLVAQAVRRRCATTSQERFLIALGAWVALQAAAVAYGRGGGSSVPIPRYQDFLSLGFVVNGVALAALVLDRPPSRIGLRRLAYAGAIAWALATGLELDALRRSALVALKSWRQTWEVQAANVRRFVITGNVAEMRAQARKLPHPSAQLLVDILQQPAIRRILPAAVRPPLGLEASRIANSAFVPQGVHPVTPRDPLTNAWGSFTGVGNRALGTFESRDLPACTDHLSIPVAGYLGLPGLALQIREVGTDRRIDVHPGALAREQYVPVAVACPSGPFVLIGSDQRPDYWFAFGDPVEIAWGSIRAEQLIELAPRLLFVSALLFILLLRLP